VADYEQNLSRGSLFLNARTAPKVGARVRIVIALSRPAVRAELSGQVVRVSRFGNEVNEAPGAQVAFDGFGRRHLSRLVESLRPLLSTEAFGA
jgi:Tfp pilus assembly protein PilZ